MNINNITVNKYALSQLLNPDTKFIFEIPKYQREYTWGLKQWEALFDDLTENEQGYFLGSIICINSTTDPILAPKFEVVDGQQRLTTFSLFLAALYDVLKTYKDNLDEDQQSDLNHFKKKLVLKNTTDGIRIVPQIQNNNRGDYLGLLSKLGIIPKRDIPKNAGNRRIEKAFNYFKERILNYISTNNTSEKVQNLFDIYEKVNAAIMVMIVVSSHSDAYTLFESLNDRGAPLSSVDLIKNLLLAKLDAEENSNINNYFDSWMLILSYLGEEYSNQERFFRQNYNAFRKALNKPFLKEDRQYPLGTIATRTTMLDIYEKIITNSPIKALNELSENAEIYGNIILNKTDNLSEQIIDSYLQLQRVQGAPSYMLMLYLKKKHEELEISEEDEIKICNLLVNFFIRRNLTDTPPTRDLTRLFMSFVDSIDTENYKGEEIYTKLREKLLSVSASDKLFESKLKGPVYEDNSGATRFILCALAEKHMTKETKQDLWKKSENNKYIWSIEHIFPQGENIPKCWVEMIADGDKDKAKELQAQYVHTFGNLTITGYNSSLGNKSFDDKKNRKDSNGNYIGYLNKLSLNEDVCDKDKWTIEIIQKRGQNLIKQILELFSL